MEGADTVAVVMAVEDTGEDLVEADFMAEVLEVIPLGSLVHAALVAGGTEEAAIGEDVPITPTEDTPTPTSVFGRILTTIPTTLQGIGLHNVIPMAGATEFGCHIIIERKVYFLKASPRHSASKSTL